MLPSLDLPWEVFSDEGLEYWNGVSYLKSGINFSDVVTTVSRRYAQEIQTAEQGFGFEGILQRRSRVLVGIRNGIDTAIWNPASDPLLPARFSAADLAGKAEVKRALLARRSVSRDGAGASGRGRVVGMVSRHGGRRRGSDLIDLVRRATGRAARRWTPPSCSWAQGDADSTEARAARSWPRSTRSACAGHASGFDEGLAHLYRGRGRHVPHAVAVRAVRPEPMYSCGTAPCRWCGRPAASTTR